MVSIYYVVCAQVYGLSLAGLLCLLLALENQLIDINYLFC